MTINVSPQLRKHRTFQAPSTGHGNVLVGLVFSIALFLALALVQPASNQNEILLPMLVVCGFSLYALFACGQRTVNASSVASYGVLMFIGFPAAIGALGLYESNKEYSPNSLLIVLVLAFLFQLGPLIVTGGSTSRTEDRDFNASVTDNPYVIRQVLRLSFSKFLLFMVCLGLGVGIALAGFAWLAPLSATVVAFWSPEQSARIRGFVLVLVTFAVETGLDLGSFERQSLGVLALSLAVIALLRLCTWIPKVITAILTGSILTFLINRRVSLLQSQRGSRDSERTRRIWICNQSILQRRGSCRSASPRSVYDGLG